jgi:hypothetical protein
VEHSPRSPRPWPLRYKYGGRGNLLFYPHSAFFFLRTPASCASPLSRGTAKEHYRCPTLRCRRCSTTPDIPIDDATAAASSPRSIAGRLDLPLHAHHRRSFTAGLTPVSFSFSVLPSSALRPLGRGCLTDLDPWSVLCLLPH